MFIGIGEYLPGVLFMTCLIAISISLLLGYSFGPFDKASRYWWLGFAIDGFSPVALSASPAVGWPMSLTAATYLHVTAIICQGYSLRILAKKNQEPLLSPIVAIVGLLVIFSGFKWWLVDQAGSTLDRTLNSIFVFFGYCWAGICAWQITRIRKSVYATQILILFIVPIAVWVFRSTLVFSDDIGTVMEGDTRSVLTVVTLTVSALLRTFCYLGLRLQGLLQFAEREARAVRDQSYALGRRNAAIASAMHVVPGCCIVTDSTLRVVYLNAEAKKVIGSDTSTQRVYMHSLLLGVQTRTFSELAGLKQVRLKTADRPGGVPMTITASVTDDDGAAIQYVFLLQPLEAEG